jgi:predicted nucleotidyltransferase
MRLLAREKTAIVKTFKEVFQTGRIYLFGSRVDDQKKGGDLDLYLVPERSLDVATRFDKKRAFSLQLEELLGEQKIDVVFSKDKNRSIEKEALQTGVLLWSGCGKR